MELIVEDTIHNRHTVARGVNGYMERLNYALSRIGLPELDDKSRIDELSESGILYGGKNVDRLLIETERRDLSYVLIISGEGRCEQLANEMSEEMRKQLLLHGANPTLEQ